MELTELYAAVPAAEEEDLLDEVRGERAHAEWSALLAGWRAWPTRAPRLWDLDGGPVDDEQDAEPETDEELPPLHQVLGLLQHRLGAQVLPD